MKFGFAGTPSFAAVLLHGLIQAGHVPALVLTQPDRRSGRGRRAQPGPVKTLALEAGLVLHQPASLKDTAATHALAAAGLDVLIVVAYGLLLPPAILATPRLGCINVHASLLPRWRGAAPIERAIVAGDTQTGVCIMQMEEGLDTGPVFARVAVPITPTSTGETLAHALAAAGLTALLETLPVLATLTPEPQQGSPRYAHKLTPADSCIDWSWPARSIERLVRALTPRAPAFATLDDLRIRILAARVVPGPPGAPPGTIIAADADGICVACGDDALAITALALNRGKGNPLSAAEACNGYSAVFRLGIQLDCSI